MFFSRRLAQKYLYVVATSCPRSSLHTAYVKQNYRLINCDMTRMVEKLFFCFKKQAKEEGLGLLEWQEAANFSSDEEVAWLPLCPALPGMAPSPLHADAHSAVFAGNTLALHTALSRPILVLVLLLLLVLLVLPHFGPFSFIEVSSKEEEGQVCLGACRTQA